MVHVIRNILAKLIDDIDAGNSAISEADEKMILSCLSEITSTRLSKEQACKYLHVSRATFDNLVHNGKLPKGRKDVGFKELSWSKSVLDEYITKHK